METSKPVFDCLSDYDVLADLSGFDVQSFGHAPGSDLHGLELALKTPQSLLCLRDVRRAAVELTYVRGGDGRTVTVEWDGVLRRKTMF